MTRMRSFFLVFGLLLAGVIWGYFQYFSGPGNWETVEVGNSSQDIARHDAGFARVEDKFYLLGGREGQPVCVFDTKTQRWTTHGVPPLDLHHFQPIVYNGKIYMVGAMTGEYPSEVPVPTIYIYEPETDTWLVGDTIPEARRRGAAGAVLYEGHIYLAGGIRDGHRGDHKNWLDRYNPETGAWEVLPDAPRPRDHFEAVVANDKLYLAAGRLSKSEEGIFNFTVPEVDVYDLLTGKWETLENDLPTPRAGNVAALYRGALLVFGGESGSQSSAHDEVEALNLDTHIWQRFARMNTGRHGAGSVIFKDKIYIVAGCDKRGGGTELSSLDAFYLNPNEVQ